MTTRGHGLDGSITSSGTGESPCGVVGNSGEVLRTRSAEPFRARVDPPERNRQRRSGQDRTRSGWLLKVESRNALRSFEFCPFHAAPPPVPRSGWPYEDGSISRC
jgi:hypothetical protein